MRWFSHVERVINALVRKSWSKLREQKKVKEDQSLVIVIKNNMSIIEIAERMTSNRIEWEKKECGQPSLICQGSRAPSPKKKFGTKALLLLYRVRHTLDN